MSNRKHTPKRDLHAEITANLIKAIEANPGKPQMPWRRSGGPLWIPENASSNATYNGINTVNLWVAAELRGFTSPLWATYRQWSELGAQVIKGAKSELVIFYKEYEVDRSPDDETDDGKRRVAKASRVFNIAEVEGFDDPGQPEPLGPIERIAKADRFILACNADIRHGGERAFYAPSTDHIQMPDEGLFCGTDTMIPGARVGLDEVKRWYTDRVPLIRRILATDRRYEGREFRFEIWSNGQFDQRAVDWLKTQPTTFAGYSIGWRDGSDMKSYAAKARSSSVRKILNEHYFHHPLAKRENLILN